MSSKTFTITSESGLHARPATTVVQALSQYTNDIFLTYKNHRVNGKSIMGVMSLGVPVNGEITVDIDNDNDGHILRELENVFEQL